MITIYDAPRSGHCHRVRLAASLMGVPFETKPVAELDGERKGPEYLAINPFGQIPAIRDGDLVVRDSNAIIRYLAEKYAPDGTWIPKNLNERTRMDEWLAVAAGPLFRGPNTARLIKVFGFPADPDLARDISTLLFEIMEAHLQDRTWLVGETPTLADIACYSYVRVADEGDLDLTPYPAIREWLSSVEALENFLPIPRP